MPVSSVSSNEWLKIQPPIPVKSKTSSKQPYAPTKEAFSQDTLTLSNKARLISEQLPSQSKTDQDDTAKSKNNESIQVSSSIGMATTATGLSREEAIAMYRSIQSMLD